MHMSIRGRKQKRNRLGWFTDYPVFDTLSATPDTASIRARLSGPSPARRARPVVGGINRRTAAQNLGACSDIGAVRDRAIHTTMTPASPHLLKVHEQWVRLNHRKDHPLYELDGDSLHIADVVATA